MYRMTHIRHCYALCFNVFIVKRLSIFLPGILFVQRYKTHLAMMFYFKLFFLYSLKIFLDYVFHQVSYYIFYQNKKRCLSVLKENQF